MKFRRENNVNHIDTKHSTLAVCYGDVAVHVQSPVVPNILHEMIRYSSDDRITARWVTAA